MEVNYELLEYQIEHLRGAMKTPGVDHENILKLALEQLREVISEALSEHLEPVCEDKVKIWVDPDIPKEVLRDIANRLLAQTQPAETEEVGE